MTINRVSGLVLLAAVGMFAAGDAPYIGKWKLDPAKSNFAGTTMTYTDLGNGEMQLTTEGITLKFKMDGKEYPDPFGGTITYKPTGNDTWESTYTMKGKLVSTDTTKLSADGNTLTVNSKGTKPNGDSFDDNTVYTRVSGGPGLAGKWKTTKVSISSPNVIEFAPNGADGVTLRVVDQNIACDAKFDGKDYPATGPMAPAGFTLAVQQKGPRSIGMTVKINGKEFYKITYTVSADGKTLTAVGAATATNEETKAVYEHQ